jgi:hypothetical protein
MISNNMALFIFVSGIGLPILLILGFYNFCHFTYFSKLFLTRSMVKIHESSWKRFYLLLYRFSPKAKDVRIDSFQKLSKVNKKHYPNQIISGKFLT